MIIFTLTQTGTTMIASAVSNNSTVLIDSVVLTQDGGGTDKTITDFTGNVIKDSTSAPTGSADFAGLPNDQLVIDFEDNSSESYSVSGIQLKSGNTIIAESEAVTIVKQSSKPLKVRITACFENASYCSFNSTSIGLPYATKARQGVIRLAKYTGEQNLNYTVFSAQDTITKIQDAIGTTGNYVPWDMDGQLHPINGSTTVQTLNIKNSSDSSKVATLQVDSSGNLNVTSATALTGSVVDSSPTFATSGGTTTITDTTGLVNGSYIAALYSDTVDTAASPTNGDKLVSSNAVKSYVESEISGLSSTYVHTGNPTGQSSETISGSKIFTSDIVTDNGALLTGDAVYDTYAAGTWASGHANEVPTVAAVGAALSAGDTAVQNALQSQIDGINAGQNLADILNSRGDDNTAQRQDDLAELNAQYLNVGDKVQILHDKTLADGTIDTTTGYTGVSTVYSLTQGTPTSSTRDVAAYNKSGYYWDYIGEYGVDAYTKSQADTRFVLVGDLDQSISSSSTNSHAPTSLAVYNAIDDLSGTIEGAYVKLSPANYASQTINSPVIIHSSSGSKALYIYEDQISTEVENDSNNILYVGAHDAGIGRFVQSAYLTTLSGIYYDIMYKVADGTGSRITFSIDLINHSVTGDAVACYSDILPTPPASATDGRLVTVDYLNYHCDGRYASLSTNNTFTGTTNTFSNNVVLNGSITGTGIYDTYAVNTWNTSSSPAASTDTAPKIPTVAAVDGAINAAATAAILDISSSTNSIPDVGAVGLFVYTEVGAEKGIGETVSGIYLKPVGMSLPTSGQISYKSATPVNAYTGTTWKLMSLAMKRTSSSDPCLVLAQRIS